MSMPPKLGEREYFSKVSVHKGEMAESAEGARLLSECGVKTPPRVRIPLSPPNIMDRAAGLRNRLEPDVFSWIPQNAVFQPYFPDRR